MRLKRASARSRSIANWFSISGYADRPSKGDHPSAPTRRCVATDRDLPQRTVGARRDQLTNAALAAPGSVPHRYNDHFLPGTRYAFCALEALSAIALNSRPVQALAVVTSEIVPAPAAASNEAMMFSASLHSEMSKKSESPVVK